MRSFPWRRVAALVAALSVELLLLALYTGTEYRRSFAVTGMLKPDGNGIESDAHRKLLLHRAASVSEAIEEPNRIWGDKCSRSDIAITQGPTDPLPNGIPTYTVQIMNVCITGCDISAIHLNCGWFSSARLINPRIFKRLRYNDCLVNDGKPLRNGRSLSFQYANTFPYGLSVSSVGCWTRHAVRVYKAQKQYCKFVRVLLLLYIFVSVYVFVFVLRFL